jgi:hypothetical protein
MSREAKTLSESSRIGLEIFKSAWTRARRERQNGAQVGSNTNARRYRATFLAILLLTGAAASGLYRDSKDVNAEDDQPIVLDYERYASHIAWSNEHPIKAGGYNKECHCGFSRLGVPYLMPGPSTGVGTVIGPVGYEDALQIAEVVDPRKILELDVPLEAVASDPETGAYLTAVRVPGVNP